MSLRFALLGLLAVEPASGYDLKRAINRSTYFIWNATGPQIYTTLHKLREDGFITSQALAQRGKPDKQIHTITKPGRAALEAFMSEPIRAAVTRDEVLLRIFFGNFATPQAMRRELEAYLDRIREERTSMETTEARITAHPLDAPTAIVDVTASMHDPTIGHDILDDVFTAMAEGGDA